VRDDVVSRIARDFVSINRDCSEALVASARSVCGSRRGFEQGSIPHRPAPVAAGADDQLANLPGQFLPQVARCAHPFLGEIDVLVRMRVMHGREDVDLAGVKVKRRAVHVLCGLGIVQNGERIIPDDRNCGRNK